MRRLVLHHSTPSLCHPAALLLVHQHRLAMRRAGTQATTSTRRVSPPVLLVVAGTVTFGLVWSCVATLCPNRFETAESTAEGSVFARSPTPQRRSIGSRGRVWQWS